jgi:hypothetical protein
MQKEQERPDFWISSGLQQEKQLAEWLNDEWETRVAYDRRNDRFGPEFRVSRIGGDYPHDEDSAARKTMVDEFIPLLKEAYKNRNAAERRQIPEEEFNNIRRIFGRLAKKVREYPLVRIPKFPELSDSWFATTGEKAREGWAVHVLFNIAKDGRLDNLKVCLRKGCGRWFIARRKDDDWFCSTKCRVAHNQSDPVFKAKHNEQARNAYAHRTRKPGKTRNVAKRRHNAKA